MKEHFNDTGMEEEKSDMRINIKMTIYPMVIIRGHGAATGDYEKNAFYPLEIIYY